MEKYLEIPMNCVHVAGQLFIPRSLQILRVHYVRISTARYERSHTGYSRYNVLLRLPQYPSTQCAMQMIPNAMKSELKICNSFLYP
jgi:hypothetical protein